MNSKMLRFLVNEARQTLWKDSGLLRETEILLERISDHFEVCKDCADAFDRFNYHQMDLKTFESVLVLCSQLRHWTCDMGYKANDPYYLASKYMQGRNLNGYPIHWNVPFLDGCLNCGLGCSSRCVSGKPVEDKNDKETHHYYRCPHFQFAQTPITSNTWRDRTPFNVLPGSESQRFK